MINLHRRTALHCSAAALHCTARPPHCTARRHRSACRRRRANYRDPDAASRQAELGRAGPDHPHRLLSGENLGRFDAYGKLIEATFGVPVRMLPAADYSGVIRQADRDRLLGAICLCWCVARHQGQCRAIGRLYRERRLDQLSLSHGDPRRQRHRHAPLEAAINSANCERRHPARTAKLWSAA